MCLRIIGLCVSLSVFVACGTDDQTPLPEGEAGIDPDCPCRYARFFPKTEECWVTPFPNADTPIQFMFSTTPSTSPGGDCTIHQIEQVVLTENPTEILLRARQTGPDDPGSCFLGQQGLAGACFGDTVTRFTTEKEFANCQRDLERYATELNNVAGISVSGGPPYICSPAPSVTIGPIM